MATAKPINMGMAIALGAALGAGLGVPMHNMASEWRLELL